MAFCRNCGTDIGDNKFCTACGAPVVCETPKSEPEKKPEPKMNVKMLVWSIINTVISAVSTLGILAIVFTVLAYDTSCDVKAKKYIKTARILNIVGSALTVLTVIAMIMYVILSIFVGGFMSMIIMSMMGMV